MSIEDNEKIRIKDISKFFGTNPSYIRNRCNELIGVILMKNPLKRNNGYSYSLNLKPIIGDLKMYCWGFTNEELEHYLKLPEAKAFFSSQAKTINKEDYVLFRKSFSGFIFKTYTKKIDKLERDMELIKEKLQDMDLIKEKLGIKSSKNK